MVQTASSAWAPLSFRPRQPVLQRGLPGRLERLRHALLYESQGRLPGQRANRKPVGIAEGGSLARYALCNAPGGDGRGDRLDEVL